MASTLRSVALGAICTALLGTSSAAHAADAAATYTVLPPVRLYEGTAPGSESPRFPEAETRQRIGRVLTNVSVPDYTPYLPAADRNTRSAVIIAPGGAFRLLAMDHEGHDLARFLAERGLASFVLKYRVIQADPSQPAFGPPPPAAAGAPEPPREPPPSMAESGRMGVADGLRAIAMVRARAGEYGIDPDRVVFIGFSAGAHVASYMGLAEDPRARANFIAPIYGAPFLDAPPPIPADMPPVFMAWAQDDTIVGPPTRAFYNALVDAGKNPEAHIYMHGGHGFGMLDTGKSSDAWREAFYNWLQAHGLAAAP